MKSPFALALMAILFAASPAAAVDCGAQFSACIYTEANLNTNDGTQACIDQRTACMAQVHANGGAVSQYPGLPAPARNVAKEHRDERQDLRAFGREERAGIRADQKDEREEAVGKLDGLLKLQAGERQEARQELREGRQELRQQQRTDGRGKMYSVPE